MSSAQVSIFRRRAWAVLENAFAMISFCSYDNSQMPSLLTADAIFLYKSIKLMVTFSV